MKTIKHNLEFVTELDETHPIAKQLLALDKLSQIAMLEGMLKSLVAPALAPILADINAGNSYALLKVAE
jgi:hypothetical protein